MSGVKLEGNALGTGVFTIKSPNSNTDRTFDLPDSSGKLVAPASEGTAGQVLTSNGAGVGPSYQNLPAGGVTSLNGETGAITNTSLYAIGSYVMGRPKNSTNYAVDSTLAGSSLYAISGGVYWSYTSNQWRDFLNGTSVSGTDTLVNTGTWRCVTPAGTSPGNTMGFTGLWVRIS